MGAYADGYFIALEESTRNFFLSSLNNGLEWDALDVAQLSSSSNNVQAITVEHRELWLVGGQTTEVWYNSGDPDFPFQPIQGVFIHHGILAPWSIIGADNTLFWLGSDKLGARTVYRMQGYTPLRVSTHPIEYLLGKSAEPERTIGFSYQDEGHTFLVFYVPDLDTTLVYDLATQLWHERAQWDYVRARWRPHVARCHCYAFGKHLVGDRQGPTIYDYSLEYLDDELVLDEGL